MTREFISPTTPENRRRAGHDEIEQDQGRLSRLPRAPSGADAHRVGSRRRSRRAGRLGHGVRNEVRLRQGHRQEGDGHADQDRQHQHADPGRRLHDDGKVVDGYFKCVNDNGGINGRPIKYIWYEDNLNPAQQRALATEARRERQGRRHRRQHELHRVRHQLEVLQVQGLHRDRRRRPGGVLRRAEHRRVEHGAALLRHRRGAGARPRRCEVAHHRLAGRRRGVRRRWRGAARKAGGRPVQELPDRLPANSTPTRRSSSSCRRPETAAA